MCSRLERSWMFKRSGFSVYMVRSKAENRRVFEANNVRRCGRPSEVLDGT